MREYFRLVKLLKPYRWLLVLSFVLVVIFSVTNGISIYLTIPLLKTLFTNDSSSTIATGNSFIAFLRHKFDAYIFSGGDKYNALVKVCALMLVFYLTKNVSGYLQSILTEYVEKKLVTDLRRKLYSKFNSLPLKYFTGNRTGDIISRIITDVNTLQNTVSVTFTDLLKQPILITVFFVMALYLSPSLTLISLVIVPLSVFIIIKIGRKLRKYSERVQEKLSEFTSIIAETVYASKIIRAFSNEKFENKRFDIKLKDYFRTMMKASVYSDAGRPITEFLSVCIGVFIIWFGGREIFAGKGLNPEEFIGFLLIIFQLMAPIKDISSVNNRIQQSSAAAKRVYEILDMQPDIFDSPDAIEKNSIEDSIELKNVSFRYDDDGKLILDNLSLRIKKFEKVAIVGLSGVGKSTLVDLLPRFYDVTSGAILIDGIDIKKIKLSSLRRMFGIVTQEIILFNDTIRNNIAYGMEDVPLEKITEAATNANAHDFITETDNKYDTIIGERGLKLSGGQKQRIAIARALLKGSQIMIFDEATSSLDTESEKLIQEAIDRLIQNNTSIIIAHRLSTIKNADRIVVLHDGIIENIGTHDDLMKDEKSIYRKLYNMQFS